MTDKREAEQEITNELANQPKTDDDSHATQSSKEKRADAEKKLNDSKAKGEKA
jgi:hypothetical protein